MNKGWFKIPGLQEGQHDAARQFRGLEIVRDTSKGTTILDLGCAEGVNSVALAEAGARLVHGADLEESRVATAQKLFAQRHPAVESKFIAYDLNRFDNLFLNRTLSSPFSEERLLSRYDIVLALAIAQKLRNPVRFLRLASTLCDGLMAIRVPFPLVKARRSRQPSADVKLMMSEDFDLLQETNGYPEDLNRKYQPGDEAWLGIFRRKRNRQPRNKRSTTGPIASAQFLLSLFRREQTE